MRNHDFYAAIRLVVFMMAIFLFAILCQGEKEMQKGERALAVSSVTIEQQEPAETWTSLGTFELTAYCPCQKCCGHWATKRPLDEAGNPIVITASGAVAEAGTTIAVDPSIIPYGSTVKINDHSYIAQDTGGAIDGNRIDVYFTDHQEALEFGRQSAEVFILGE